MPLISPRRAALFSLPFITLILAAAPAPVSASGGDVAELCHAELARRIAMGHSKIRLLRDGFHFLWGDADSPLLRTVRCEGSQPARRPANGSDELVFPFQVRSVALETRLEPAPADGPGHLGVDASITVAGEGTLQYRIEHNGVLGPVRAASFPSGSPRRAVLSLAVPLSSCARGQESPRLAATEEAAMAREISGSLRLIVVSPQRGVRASSVAEYRVPAPRATAARTLRSRATSRRR